MHRGWLFLIILLLKNVPYRAEITPEQYASVPEVFLTDNFDNCMMRGREAFYCAITYELEPIDEQNPNEMWNIIKNLSDVHTNYRHDWLRHWICVPQACPGINKTTEDDPELKKALEKCYDAKYKSLGLKGIITQVQCETSEARYPFDWLDLFALIFFASYIGFVLHATVFEGIMRYRTQEEYDGWMGTNRGKLLSAFSITRNWIRLKTISNTSEIEKLRCIQGIRVYNTGLVILCHTLLGFVVPPVANTRYTETMHLKNGSLFFSSGPLCVTTFFFISSFLLANSLFDYMKKKPMTLKTIVFIFLNRIFRITPTLLVVVLFHATLLRHLGSGPYWHTFISVEYVKCRANWWTNLLYINNWINYYNMCVPVTWYLGLDTQYFLLSLFFIWFLKSHENRFVLIMCLTVLCYVVGTFLQNYYHDFTALSFPNPEMYYGMTKLANSHQFHWQLASAIGNMAGPIVGIASGYYFSKHKFDKVPLFNTKRRLVLWWTLTFGLGFSIVIFPGLIILNENVEHDRVWASIYVALSRPLHATAMALAVLGFAEGVGWLALRVLQWSPTYILGRLSLSAYLLHMSIVFIRPSLARYPLHLSDFQIGLGFLGDLGTVYIAATLLTLFLELPVSELQKYVFGQKDETDQQNKDK